ncbi:hypothetical protein [Telmatospirillum sp. J64-1]|uniref:hypothetical protein n=1 Tax=Telmatospirillum sp. J64-1 TaxID=2502183 RepID=UPI00115DA0C2|nr:hypothetical protein [Telmatospirillum sp. J64-1]
MNPNRAVPDQQAMIEVDFGAQGPEVHLSTGGWLILVLLAVVVLVMLVALLRFIFRPRRHGSGHR